MEIKNLSKSIDKKMILENVNLSIPKGVICGIVGRNGSGKTTLFRTIASHYLLDSGQIFIDGHDINQENDFKNDIFYLDMQFMPLKHMNPRQMEKYLSLLYPNFDNGKFWDLLYQSQLPDQRFQSYSKGMQALMVVVLAICSNCTYIILDEPLDGLDLLVRKQVISLMIETISDQERSIIIASHNLNELEKLVDQIAFLKEGIITSSFTLEKEKESTQKYQLVFKEKSLPDFVEKYGTIISSQGRVLTVIFENYNDELHQKLVDSEPLLMENLPLTLEDLFLNEFPTDLYQDRIGEIL